MGSRWKGGSYATGPWWSPPRACKRGRGRRETASVSVERVCVGGVVHNTKHCVSLRSKTSSAQARDPTLALRTTGQQPRCGPVCGLTSIDALRSAGTGPARCASRVVTLLIAILFVGKMCRVASAAPNGGGRGTDL